MRQRGRGERDPVRVLRSVGYGASEVYFQNNCVAGWKNDPSAPLRISSH
jgi:hypothetical protein